MYQKYIYNRKLNDEYKYEKIDFVSLESTPVILFSQDTEDESIKYREKVFGEHCLTVIA